MITIHYISTKNTVIEVLQSYYEKEGIKFYPYSPNLNWDKISYFLLIEPVQIKTEEYALSKLWKAKLYKEAPHVHLIVATFAKSMHPNFLNLSMLPESLTFYFQQTYPVNKFIVESHGTENKNGFKLERIFDPWERSLPISGQVMKEIIIRFFHGHDKTNSYLEQLIRLSNRMADLAYGLQKTTKDDQTIKLLYLSIQKEWNKLQNRWYQYEDLMPLLPFSKDAEKISEQMKIIGHLIGDNDWSNFKSKPDISPFEIIIRILEEDFLPYIYAKKDGKS